MDKITKLEKILSLYSSWRPSDIAFVKEIKWYSNTLVINFYSQLRDRLKSWPDLSETFFEISMTFKGVTDFKLYFNGMGPERISGFDILDISDRGMEKLNFQIEDYENDNISFMCGSIEVNEVFNPAKLLLNIDD